MSTQVTGPHTGGDIPVNGAIVPCPLTKCEAVVYCIDGRFMAVDEIEAIVGSEPAKPTDKMGTASFPDLKPPDQNYTATVTLKGDALKKYIWRDQDGATNTMTWSRRYGDLESQVR